MTSEFTVKVTAHFDRDFKKLLKGHPDLAENYPVILLILKTDPYNFTRTYPIKKLEGIPAGQGQYRIRAGHFRFRYDIESNVVYLKTCGLRREETYR